MTDLIVIAIILAIVISASVYIYRAKKNGASCIGCPHARNCKSGSCNCETTKE